MKWEMEMEEVEAALEKIWDLHDKVSDAIHTISKTHFLRSIKGLGRRKHQAFLGGGAREGEGGGGGAGQARAEEARRRPGGSCLSRTSEGAKEEDDEGDTIAEVRSLNAIRSMLENLERWRGRKRRASDPRNS